jgi:hypothetical protein
LPVIGVEVMGHGVARNGNLPLLCNEPAESCRLFLALEREPENRAPEEPDQ